MVKVKGKVAGRVGYEAPAARLVALNKQSGHVQKLPINYKELYEKASLGKASPRQAIKAKCQECVGYEDVANRVGECECHLCPLWAYRPYQKAGNN